MRDVGREVDFERFLCVTKQLRLFPFRAFFFLIERAIWSAYFTFDLKGGYLVNSMGAENYDKEIC